MFLYYYLSSHKIRKQIEQRVDGLSHKKISLELIGSLEIDSPPLAEQKRIVAILSTCDEEIEILRQLAEARQWQKRGLMQQLLTGKKRVRV